MVRKKSPSPINVDEGRWLASISFFVVSSIAIVIEQGLDDGNQRYCIRRAIDVFGTSDADSGSSDDGSPDEELSVAEPGVLPDWAFSHPASSAIVVAMRRFYNGHSFDAVRHDCLKGLKFECPIGR
jgi:hypothetical protein